jgi:hypothetical protein
LIVINIVDIKNIIICIRNIKIVNIVHTTVRENFGGAAEPGCRHLALRLPCLEN